VEEALVEAEEDGVKELVDHLTAFVQNAGTRHLIREELRASLLSALNAERL